MLEKRGTLEEERTEDVIDMLPDEMTWMKKSQREVEGISLLVLLLLLIILLLVVEELLLR